MGWKGFNHGEKSTQGLPPFRILGGVFTSECHCHPLWGKPLLHVSGLLLTSSRPCCAGPPTPYHLLLAPPWPHPPPPARAPRSSISRHPNLPLFCLHLPRPDDKFPLSVFHKLGAIARPMYIYIYTCIYVNLCTEVRGPLPPQVRSVPPHLWLWTVVACVRVRVRVERILPCGLERAWRGVCVGVCGALAGTPPRRRPAGAPHAPRTPRTRPACAPHAPLMRLARMSAGAGPARARTRPHAPARALTRLHAPGWGG